MTESTSQSNSNNKNNEINSFENSMEELIVKQTFQQLKPHTVPLMEAQTNIRMLRSKIKSEHSQQSPNNSTSQQRTNAQNLENWEQDNMKDENQEQTAEKSTNNQQQFNSIPSALSSVLIAATQQSINSLSSLIKLLPSLAPIGLCRCFDYLFFPISQVLMTNNQNQQDNWKGSQTMVEKALEVCQIILQSCSKAPHHLIPILTNPQSYLGMFQLILQYLSTTPQSTSEELKLAAMRAMKELISATHLLLTDAETTNDLPPAFSTYLFSAHFRVGCGYYLSQLLTIIKKEKSKELKRVGLDSIEVTIQLFSSSSEGLPFLTTYSPGLLSALYNLLQTPKQGTTVYCQSIALIGKVTIAVLAEEDIKEIEEEEKAVQLQTNPQLPTTDGSLQSKFSKLQSLIQTAQQSQTTSQHHQRLIARHKQKQKEKQENTANKQIIAVRDGEWLQTTTQRIGKIIESLYSKITIQHTTPITLSYLTNATVLLQHCSYTLRESIHVVVEYIVAQSRSDIISIRDKSVTILTDLSTIFPTPTLSLLITRLEYHFFSLYRNIKMATEQQQLLTLHIVTGYIELLSKDYESSSNVCNLLVQHYDKIMYNLLETVRIDTADTQVQEQEEVKISQQSKEEESIEDEVVDSFLADSLQSDTTKAKKSTKQSTSDSAPAYYQVRFLFLQSDATRTSAIQLIQSLGYCLGSTIPSVFDMLITSLNDPNYQYKQKEMLFCINQLVLGLSKAMKEDKLQLNDIVVHIDLLMNEYIAAERWKMLLQSTDNIQQSLGNSIIISLLLRGLGDIAELLEMEFQPYLMSILYPLLEQVGNENHLISQTALTTLHRIAVHCHYNDVSTMMIQNADYIVEQIAQHLRELKEINKRYSKQQSLMRRIPNPTYAGVLTSLLSLTHAPTLLLPYLDDVLTSVLDHIGEYVYTQQKEGTEELAMLYSVVKVISRMEPVLQPSAHSQLYHSAPPLSTSFALLTTDSYYSSNNLRERLLGQAKTITENIKSQQEEEEFWLRQKQQNSNDKPGESARQWFEEMEIERKKREQKKLNGGMMFEEEGDEQKEDEEIEEGTDKKKEEEDDKLTREQQTVLDILTQCKHLIASPSTQQQYQVLCIIDQSIPILSQAPKSLFPAMAQIWPAYKLLFRAYHNTTLLNNETFGTQSEQQIQQLFDVTKKPVTPKKGQQLVEKTTRHTPVFIKALEVLETMTVHTSRFLSNRISSDVLPILYNVLKAERSWFTELQNFSPAAILQSPAYKVQISLLKTLTAIIRFPDLSKQHIIDLAHHCAAYLSSEQPIVIQDHARTLFTHFIQLDPNSICYELISRSVYHEHQLIQSFIQRHQQIQQSRELAFLKQPQFTSNPNISLSLMFQQQTHAFQQSAQLETTNEYKQNAELLLRQCAVQPEEKLALY